MSSEITRRPLKVRHSRLANTCARWLTRARVTPNAISVAGVVFAGIGAGCCAVVASSPEPIRQAVGLILAAVMIQLRLWCNLMDGMVAIEGGRRTPCGELYNEIPDRFSDAFSLVGAGYAAAPLLWVVPLGWLAAILAVITAYVRALGASLGTGQHFAGPMAKPARMATLTIALPVEALLRIQPRFSGWAVSAALIIILAGTALTIAGRIRLIARGLEQAHRSPETSPSE